MLRNFPLVSNICNSFIHKHKKVDLPLSFPSKDKGKRQASSFGKRFIVIPLLTSGDLLKKFNFEHCPARKCYAVYSLIGNLTSFCHLRHQSFSRKRGLPCYLFYGDHLDGFPSQFQITLPEYYFRNKIRFVCLKPEHSELTY